MRKYATAKEMHKIDCVAIDTWGIPSLVLMETAGRLTAEKVFQYCQRKRLKRAVVVCGSGNNAGDGYVIARLLTNQGISVSLINCVDVENLSHDAVVQFSVCKKMKIALTSLKRLKKYQDELGRADVIVDAIFGVGLTRSIEAPYAGVVEAINVSKKYVVAVDVPSGLDSTTGKVLGCCVKANETVTFTMAKKGFSSVVGKKMVGRVTVVDIGIPKVIIKSIMC